MPLSKAKQAERMRAHRRRGVIPKSRSVIPNEPIEYPALLHAIVNNRKKLEKVCQSLGHHGVLNEVRYGCYGPTFSIVADWLDATRLKVGGSLR